MNVKSDLLQSYILRRDNDNDDHDEENDHTEEK